MSRLGESKNFDFEEWFHYKILNLYQHSQNMLALKAQEVEIHFPASGLDVYI